MHKENLEAKSLERLELILKEAVVKDRGIAGDTIKLINAQKSSFWNMFRSKSRLEQQKEIIENLYEMGEKKFARKWLEKFSGNLIEKFISENLHKSVLHKNFGKVRSENFWADFEILEIGRGCSRADFLFEELCEVYSFVLDGGYEDTFYFRARLPLLMNRVGYCESSAIKMKNLGVDILCELEILISESQNLENKKLDFKNLDLLISENRIGDTDENRIGDTHSNNGDHANNKDYAYKNKNSVHKIKKTEEIIKSIKKFRDSNISVLQISRLPEIFLCALKFFTEKQSEKKIMKHNLIFYIDLYMMSLIFFDPAKFESVALKIQYLKILLILGENKIFLEKTRNFSNFSNSSNSSNSSNLNNSSNNCFKEIEIGNLEIKIKKKSQENFKDFLIFYFLAQKCIKKPKTLKFTLSDKVMAFLGDEDKFRSFIGEFGGNISFESVVYKEILMSADVKEDDIL